MIRINKFLSSKEAAGLCIIIALISRVINVFFVSYAGRDKMFLVLQSKSLLEGKGLSIPQYFLQNPDVPIYDFTPHWPPGYPILLAPFLKIFNYDIYWATSTLDIILCICLIFIIRKICIQIGMPKAGVNIMTLVTGCFEYTFINESLPTDTVSLVLFLTGLSLTIRLLFIESFSMRIAVAASLFLFLPSLFRYNYPAISIGIIVLILLIGIRKKDALLRKKGVALMFITSILTLGFFILMKLKTGHAAYAAPTERGFYPGNIIHWFPVIPSSFINIAFLTSQGVHLTSLSFDDLMIILEIINVVCVTLLVFFFLSLFFKAEFIKTLTPFKVFLILGFTASAILFGILGYLSLTYAVQKGFLHDWNYIYEPRYFAFANTFLQIAFIGWAFLYQRTQKNYFQRILIWSLSLLLFIEVSHNIYFNTKVALNFKKYKSVVYREQDYSYFVSLMNEIRGKYPGYEIWAAAPGDNFYQYLATYHGFIGIANPDRLKSGLISVNLKTLLILMLYDHEKGDYQNFLSASKSQVLKKINDSNFYLIELTPP
jgi:hypothetical protein